MPCSVRLRPACVLAILTFLFLQPSLRPTQAEETGFTFLSSPNFSAGAPSKALTREVLDQAEALRKEIAREWLGHELPEGREFTLIHVRLVDGIDEGRTLIAGGQISGHHRIWLRTQRERAVGSTLAHEISHVVMNARFPEGMPVWANEGIASLQDDPQRAVVRSELLNRWARANDWPSLALVLNARNLPPTSENGYAVAVSLTEMLLARGDRGLFLQFVEDGPRLGWDTALKTHYGITGITALQQQWQAWVGQTLAARR